MKGYAIDHAALVYIDSVALVLHDEAQHDPLDAVLILTDVQAQAGFKRDKFCHWCENWASEEARPKDRDSLWVHSSGRPLRPGCTDPLVACGNCVIGKLEEVDLPDPEPLIAVDRKARLELQARTVAAQITELEADPERWEGRIRALRERHAQLERRQAEQQAHSDLRAGKRRVLVQTYERNIPTGPPVEHWERWQDWDPDGVGNDRRVRVERNTRNPLPHKALLGKCIL